ncbi:MAG TPA: 16S rRNA (uracil(1498)-N(3))-methyltransferase [Gammaproteobacteria bacterium]|nr:16S rRNA (uracil(1498)-N(3))-methyltransferase [Gammaproteobacteria bacterium]
MRGSRLYTDQPLEPGGEITLSDERHHYLIRVLRHPRGAPITLFNGDGRDFMGKLIYADQKFARVQLHDAVTVDNESPLQIELYQALSKGEKMDWIVQKATELGAAAMQPIMTEHSQRAIQETKIATKLAHWRRIVISASEQCGRAQLMAIKSPVSFHSALAQATGDIVLCSPTLESGQHIPTISGCLSLFIGAEGGFAASEIQEAVAAGAQLLSLGPRILRTETAAVVALTVAQWQGGDLRSS